MERTLSRLGRVGAFTAFTPQLPPELARAEVQAIEALGYSSLWIGDVGDCMAHAGLYLGWTEEMVVGTGVANIYWRDPAMLSATEKILGAAYPGRFILGIGVSHPTRVEPRGYEYGRPIATMRKYLDEMDAAVYEAHTPEQPVPRVLGALGPRMLELAGERTQGAISVMAPIEHTAFARQHLGQDGLLVVEQKVALNMSEADARAATAPLLDRLLAAENYRRNLARFGYEPADAFEQTVAWGDVDAITTKVQAHLDAGADHVVVMPLPHAGYIDQLRELGPALLSL